MKPLDRHIREDLNRRLTLIGTQLGADVVTIVSPILPGLELRLRDAIDALPERQGSVVVILDTPGGVVEVVERMVTALRAIYAYVTVIVPDQAMSAGTILALSADRILMDHLSCLGPIDPQIEKDGKLVPALSYLQQFERLNMKAQEGQLTTAEYALLSKLDLGELYQFEQARELSIELLIKWLSQYKFKHWTTTETRGIEVTPEMRIGRAKEIAALLNETGRWHSHGRAIDMRTLQEEVGLKIDDIREAEFHKCVRDYFELLKDYMQREQLFPSSTPGSISDMVTRVRRSPLREEVVQRNAKVNEATIAAHERLEQELKKLGVDTKPRYQIEPPLGSSRTRLHSRNG